MTNLTNDHRLNSLAIHEEKKVLIAQWLAVFQYSTRRILLELLKRKNQSFFQALEKSDFIIRVRTDMVKDDLVILGKNGFSFAREISDYDIGRLVKPTNIPHNLVRHELALQEYLLSQGFDFSQIIPARKLDYTHKNKLPDALVSVTNSERSYKEAIELERHRKSNNRIFQAFYNHAYTIGKLRYYDKVTYVFPNEALLENYKNKFDQEEWPVFEFNKRRRIYEELSEPFACPEAIKKRFFFTTMEMV